MGVVRCYKYHSFGHMARQCDRQVACSLCGMEGHVAGVCRSDPNRPQCVNCSRLGYKDISHGVAWFGCPAFLTFQRRQKDRIQYSVSSDGD